MVPLHGKNDRAHFSYLPVLQSTIHWFLCLYIVLVRSTVREGPIFDYEYGASRYLGEFSCLE